DRCGALPVSRQPATAARQASPGGGNPERGDSADTGYYAGESCRAVRLAELYSERGRGRQPPRSNPYALQSGNDQPQGERGNCRARQERSHRHAKSGLKYRIGRRGAVPQAGAEAGLPIRGLLRAYATRYHSSVDSSTSSSTGTSSSKKYFVTSYLNHSRRLR